jgi:hypothetical protein
MVVALRRLLMSVVCVWCRQWILAGQAPWELSVQQAASCTASMLGCGGGDTLAVYEQLLSDATKYGEQVRNEFYIRLALVLMISTLGSRPSLICPD